MIRYLGRFLSNDADVIEMMSDLLKKKEEITWNWDEPQKKAFLEVKLLLTMSLVLTFYDPTKSIVIAADTSSNWLEATLHQESRG